MNGYKKSKSPAARRGRKTAAPPTDDETRSAVAATVAWMLSLMATTLAEMTGLAMRGLVVLGRPPDFVRILADVMLFVALVAGMMTLALTPVVLRLRRVAPPRVIVVIAVVAGLVPLAVVVAQRLH